MIILQLKYIQLFCDLEHSLIVLLVNGHILVLDQQEEEFDGVCLLICLSFPAMMVPLFHQADALFDL